MKKLTASLFLASFLLLSFQEKTVFADELDDRITSQKQTLETLSASTTATSAALTQTLNAIQTIETQISNVKQQLNVATNNIATLSQEVATLEELITKRSLSINEQARNLQTTHSATNFIDSLFSADSIVESITNLLAMAEITSASYEQLEQQRLDKLALQEKQDTLEQTALTYANQSADLELLRSDLLTKTADAYVTLTQLQIEQANAEADLTALEQQKQEALTKQQEALALAASRQATIAAQKQTAQETRTISTTVATVPSQEPATTQVASQSQAPVVTASPIQSEPTTTTTPAPQTTTEQVTQSSGYISPITNPSITSGFGIARSFTLSNGQFYSDVHNGIDLVNGNNSAPILSVASGTVVWSGYQTAGGNGVIVKLTNGLYAHYFHMSSLSVYTGQTVSQGQQLGVIGATGQYVTGIHLHFGLSTSLYGGYVDPAAYISF